MALLLSGLAFVYLGSLVLWTGIHLLRQGNPVGRGWVNLGVAACVVAWYPLGRGIWRLVTGNEDQSPLTEWREQYGLSIAELANLCNVPEAEITRIEAGQQGLVGEVQGYLTTHGTNVSMMAADHAAFARRTEAFDAIGVTLGRSLSPATLRRSDLWQGPGLAGPDALSALCVGAPFPSSAFLRVNPWLPLLPLLT